MVSRQKTAKHNGGRNEAAAAKKTAAIKIINWRKTGGEAWRNLAAEKWQCGK